MNSDNKELTRYQKNKPHILKYQEKNKEALKLKRKEYYLKNKERLLNRAKEYQKDYYKDNREKIIARNLKRYNEKKNEGNNIEQVQN